METDGCFVVDVVAIDDEATLVAVAVDVDVAVAVDGMVLLLPIVFFAVLRKQKKINLHFAYAN